MASRQDCQRLETTRRIDVLYICLLNYYKMLNKCPVNL